MPGERARPVLDAATAPTTHAVAGIWARYRPPLLAALPSGAVAGGLTAVGLQLDGLGQGDATSVLATALLCAAVGVLLAAVAALGAVAAVLLSQQRLRAQRSIGYGTIATGAGVAVGAVTLLVGAASGAWDGGRPPVALIVALAAALIAAVAAAVVTALSLRWRRLIR